MRLAEALADRASFRRFCGFASHEPTPERTAFVRFRAELVRRGLDRVLFERVIRQLDAYGLMVRTGTLVDATLLPSASVAHDTAELDATLPEAPGDTYGDSADAGSRPEAVIRARGGTPRVVHTGTWGGAEALARLQAHNAEVRRVRARIEKVFGTMKRSYGLRRMRWLARDRFRPSRPGASITRWNSWLKQAGDRKGTGHALGLAKAGLQVRLAAMAYNLRRSWRTLATRAA